MNDDGLAELGRKLQLALEERALTVVRSVVPVEVEPGLADRDGALVAEQLAELVETPSVFVGGLVRVDPEGGENPLLPPGDGEGLAAGGEPGADRDDPLHPGRLRAGHEDFCRLGARIEVRMGVGQAAAAGRSTRGKSGAAGSIPSVWGVSPAATRSSWSSTGCRSAPRIRGVVSGR